MKEVNFVRCSSSDIYSPDWNLNSEFRENDFVLKTFEFRTTCLKRARMNVL